MKYIKYIGAFLLLILVVKCISSSPEEVNPTANIDTNIDKWYSGGNLHQAKISEWKVATEENKLATCADFVANIKKDLPMSELKIKSIEMKNCIDEATRGLSSTDNQKANEIAALCALQLGY
ncbi:hypothetical protein [Flavobacterium sp.]|uniref:hypothetical protein n=1 Tax=Flavobacterium sp. TaxID=239 RepID=UPI003751ADC6